MSNTVLSGTLARAATVAAGTLMAVSGFALSAHAAGLTDAQVNAIVSLVASFGADSTTLAHVQAALTGTAYTPAPVSGGTAISPSAGGTSGSPCTPPSSNLAQGATDASTGGQVTLLQQALIHAGFLVGGGATGYFGPITAEAVVKFQASVGVSAIGQVGPATRAALGNVCMRVTPPIPVNTAPSASGSTTTTTSVSSASTNALFTNVDGQLSGLNSDLGAADDANVQTDDTN